MKYILHHNPTGTLKKLMTGTFLICMFLFSGCGNAAELDAYKANMTQFFENVKTYDAAINSINPESETAVSDLLSVLDAMDNGFAQMASLEVPDGFPGVDELADEASEYMTEAVSCYHQAFEAEPFDTVLADVAKQNYDRANLRLQYIISILHGDIPEEIYVYEDSETSEDENPEEVFGESPETDDTETQSAGFIQQQPQ